MTSSMDVAHVGSIEKGPSPGPELRVGWELKNWRHHKTQEVAPLLVSASSRYVVTKQTP